MEAYYNNQASNSMPPFSGHYRQRGSGFGALAAGIGRVALPLARRLIWPAAKTIGRELLVQGAPELLEFATKKKSAKQALKSSCKNSEKTNRRSTSTRTKSNLSKKVEESIQKAVSTKEKDHFAKNEATKESIRFLLKSKKCVLTLLFPQRQHIAH